MIKITIEENSPECILHLIFANISQMSLHLENISNFVEKGTIKTRQGHNFPIVKGLEFFNQKKVSDSEKYIQGILSKTKMKYCIAYIKGDIQTKKHEISHAKFYLDEKYRIKVMNIWESLNNKQKNNVCNMLQKMGYDDSVFIDEFQAYLFTERNNFFGFKINIV